MEDDARSAGDGPELSGGVDVLPQERSDLHQQRLSLWSKLPDAHGFPRHPGAWEGRADVRVGEYRRDRGAVAEDKAVRHAPGAVPDGVLPSFGQRTDRRSEDRLEGQRTLGG